MVSGSDETGNTTETDGDSESDREVGPDTGADVGHDLDAKRTTAPMDAVTSRSAAAGLVVLALGSIVAFGVPVLLV